MIGDVCGLLVWVGGGIMAVGALVTMLGLLGVLIGLATGYIVDPLE